MNDHESNEECVEEFDEGLYEACIGEHIEIIDLMIKKGVHDFNSGLFAACQGGKIEVINLMIEKGAND